MTITSNNVEEKDRNGFVKIIQNGKHQKLA